MQSQTLKKWPLNDVSRLCTGFDIPDIKVIMAIFLCAVSIHVTIFYERHIQNSKIHDVNFSSITLNPLKYLHVVHICYYMIKYIICNVCYILHTKLFLIRSCSSLVMLLICKYHKFCVSNYIRVKSGVCKYTCNRRTSPDCAQSRSSVRVL